MIRFNLKGLRQQGDTIVEVIISMTILALVISVAFVSSGHSLSTTTDAGNRNEAIGYGQQQVEYLKNGYTSSSPAKYLVAGPYCILADGSVDTGSPYKIDSATGTCIIPAQAPYQTGVTYDNKQKLFTVKTIWASQRPNDPNNITVYYRLPQ